MAEGFLGPVGCVPIVPKRSPGLAGGVGEDAGAKVREAAMNRGVKGDH
jgi:hypothetical protein